jgi:phage-related baseplate assembly protein
MTGFKAVDLSKLPAPQVVEPLNFETILAERKAKLAELFPPIAEFLNLESEPAVKLQETGSYRELIHYARVNDAARSVMLAFAVGSDLDHLGAIFGVTRLDAETDERLRTRIGLAPEAYPGAGPAGGIVYHAMTASPLVKDVGLARVAYRGEIRVAILSSEGDGTPSDEVLDAVRARLTDDAVKLMTDTISVLPVEIVPYAVDLRLRIPKGPDRQVVKAAAEAALASFTASRHRVGHEVFVSAISAAAHVPNVEQVVIASPMADIVTGDAQAPYCTAITVATELIDG